MTQSHLVIEEIPEQVRLRTGWAVLAKGTITFS